MKLLACGINHKTAPLTLREKIVFLPEFIREPLQELRQHPQIHEAAILSTCNRTEVYCHTQADGNLLLDWLGQRHQLSLQELQPHLYIHEDTAAVQHMLRVACGLDSMILGEPQILGQMKAAFMQATAAGTLGTHLGRLFQYIFSVTKQVRHQTALGANAVSIAFAAVNLLKHIFSNLANTQVLLIGAGDTIDLTARYLHDNAVQALWVANRSRNKAEELAQIYNASSISLTALPHYLKEMDIVISATASPLPILGKGMVESALKTRKHRPLVLIDLAVPRDIEPEVAQLDDVYLYNIDDLQNVIAENLRSRKKAAQQAEAMISAQAEHFMRWLRSLNAVKTIRAYRSQAEEVRDQELQKALQQIKQGEEPSAVIARLARTLTNKLMHAPTIAMRQASYNGQLELLDAAQRLFKLPEIN